MRQLDYEELQELKQVNPPQATQQFLNDLAEKLELPVEGRAVLWVGDPHEALVIPRGDLIEVHEFAVEWRGPHTPVVVTKPFDQMLVGDLERASTLVQRAGQKRRSRFRRCRTCGRLTAPEHGGSHCHSCMERQGVVF